VAMDIAVEDPLRSTAHDQAHKVREFSELLIRDYLRANRCDAALEALTEDLARQKRPLPSTDTWYSASEYLGLARLMAANSANRTINFGSVLEVLIQEMMHSTALKVRHQMPINYIKPKKGADAERPSTSGTQPVSPSASPANRNRLGTARTMMTSSGSEAALPKGRNFRFGRPSTFTSLDLPRKKSVSPTARPKTTVGIRAAPTHVNGKRVKDTPMEQRERTLTSMTDSTTMRAAAEERRKRQQERDRQLRRSILAQQQLMGQRGLDENMKELTRGMLSRNMRATQHILTDRVDQKRHFDRLTTRKKLDALTQNHVEEQLGIKKKRECALCCQSYSDINLPCTVSLKAVVDLRKFWDAQRSQEDHEEEDENNAADGTEAKKKPKQKKRRPATAPTKPTMRAPLCYDRVKVCRFCAQFFSGKQDDYRPSYQMKMAQRTQRLDAEEAKREKAYWDPLATIQKDQERELEDLNARLQQLEAAGP